MQRSPQHAAAARPRISPFILTLCVLIAAATSLAAAPDHAGAKDAFSAELQGCAARGGVEARGPFGEAYCRISYPDGGRTCTDMSQCIGGCIYQSRSGGPIRPLEGRVAGVCQRFNVQYGCFARVYHFHLARMLCID